MQYCVLMLQIGKCKGYIKCGYGLHGISKLREILQLRSWIVIAVVSFIAHTTVTFIRILFMLRVTDTGPNQTWPFSISLF